MGLLYVGVVVGVWGGCWDGWWVWASEGEMVGGGKGCGLRNVGHASKTQGSIKDKL